MVLWVILPEQAIKYFGARELNNLSVSKSVEIFNLDFDDFYHKISQTNLP
jgi:hypothetical protein